MMPFDEAVARLTAYQDWLEAALQHGQAAYDRAFESPPPGIGAHEIDGNKIVLRVNSGELAILGYRPDQMVGRSIVDFIVLQGASSRAIEKKLQEELPLRPFARTFRRADGSAVFLALVDRHLRDPKQRTVIGIRTAIMEAAPDFS